MVSYSPRAARALSFLKRPFNDVDIFVEDTGNHNMWLALIRRILPNGLRLASVNLLGGRASVVEACRLDQSETGRPKLYIVDGDFDHLLGRRKKPLKHFYRLRAYCVENILITEAAVVQIGLAWQPTRTEAQIAASFNFPKWIEDIKRKLMPLFVVYATANKLAPTLQTVGYPVRQLYRQTNHGPEIDASKVTQRIRSVASSVARQVGLATYRQTRLEISRRAAMLSEQEAISGKDYILPLLLIHLGRVIGFRGTYEQLKVHLANVWEPTNEPWFARRIRALAH